MPCGGGFYAERLAARGHVTAVDASDDYLAQARDRLAALPADVRKADAYALPFPAGTFDLVFCAQSLISLDPERAVKELARVCKPGGTVAVLEADEYHHVLLPWPIDLEAALPAALLAGSRAKFGKGTKLAPARKLRPVLQAAGLPTVRRHTSTADRAAPFDADAADFVRHHFAHLREVVLPHLPAAEREQFEEATGEGKAASCTGRMRSSRSSTRCSWLNGEPAASAAWVVRNPAVSLPLAAKGVRPIGTPVAHRSSPALRGSDSAPEPLL